VQFRSKHDLPFRLLADEEHQVAELYGVWGEKSMYGKQYFGIIREGCNEGVTKASFAVLPKKAGFLLLEPGPLLSEKSSGQRHGILIHAGEPSRLALKANWCTSFPSAVIR